MKRLFLLVLVLAVAATAASCSKRVIARINGERITQEDFDKELQQSPYARSILEQMLMNRLVAQEAKKKGVSVTDAEVAEALKKQRESVGSQWQQALKQSGLTEKDFEKTLREQLLMVKLFVSEQEARKFFDEHHEMFDTPAQISFRRIVLGSKQEAEQVRKEIMDGKAKFEEVARTKSLDQYSASRGGEIGPVAVSVYVQSMPQLKDILEKQPLNEVSAPATNSNPEGSYQIVQIVARTPEVKAKFENKRLDALVEALKARRLAISQAMSDLRAKATVEVLEPRFHSLQEDWTTLKERKPTAAPQAPQPPAASQPAKPAQGGQPQGNVQPKPKEESKPPAPKPGP